MWLLHHQAAGYVGRLLGYSANGRNASPKSSSRSFNIVAFEPQKRPICGKAHNSPWKLELNDRPHPKTPNRRCLLHHSHVSKRVCDIDHVATPENAADKEYDLSEGGLVPRRQAGKYSGVRGMRMKRVNKKGENYRTSKQCQQSIQTFLHGHSSLPRNAWRALVQTVDHTIRSTEYWWWTKVSSVKCSMDKHTVQSNVSKMRSAVGGNFPSSSSSSSSSSLSLLLLWSSLGFGIFCNFPTLAAGFFMRSNSFCLLSACANRFLSSASSSNVLSLGPDRSGCLSLIFLIDSSFRRLAILCVL